METVVVIECQSYNEEEVYLAVKKAIEQIRFIIHENISVLIKPNIMTQNRPNQHTGTHYTVVSALCQILKERNCRIIIGESSAFYQNGLTKKAFATSGMDKVAEKFDAKLIAFEEEPLIRIEKNLKGLKEIYVPGILLEVDMVINVCKLKTHGSLRLAGAIKNIYGCLPGGYKQKIHRLTGNEFELSDVFIDLHNLVKPSLSVMDAIISLDGGPTALGRPVRTSRIFASTNAAAMDVIAARMIGYQPEELPILIEAKKRGMIANFEDIEVLGNYESAPFKKLVKKDLHRAFNKNSIFVKDTYVELAISSSRCKICETCISACPVGAIREKNGQIQLDTATCISCYYCLSVCPKKAIRIKSSFRNKLIRGIRWIARI